MQDGVTDEINLKWLVPQDDGGFPITGKVFEIVKFPYQLGSEKKARFFLLLKPNYSKKQRFFIIIFTYLR